VDACTVTTPDAITAFDLGKRFYKCKIVLTVKISPRFSSAGLSSIDQTVERQA